ncbi:hypothetical protein RI129_008165 [Pyrocoelia pectoralis]|uniref:C2H2-type domain-containing protein n=1 Tax=Pyrocoelia pectoralis TaxID=417401 RepID=A0AAN7V859_9COLE
MCDISRFRCPKCSRSYKYKHILNRHIKYECGLPPQFACNMCSFKTKRRYDLTLHIKICYASSQEEYNTIKSGNDLTRYGCSKYWYLNLPMKIELREWQGWTLQEYSVPSQAKTRKPTPASKRIRGNFNCVTCGRTYVRKDSLQRHITYECGKDPQFQCPFCPQKCKRKGHQMRHIRRQHKDKIRLVEENNPDIKIDTVK